MSNKRPQKKSKVSNSGPKRATPKLRVKTVAAPVARAAKVQNKGASIRNLSGGGCVITHSEMIGTLSSQSVSVFQLLKRLRINPGSVQTFPWLSRISPNYEMYKFLKLHFRYETRSPTTLGGSLIMSPEYDAADGLNGADAEQTLYNNKGSVNDAVWKQIVLKLEPSLMNKLYKAHVVMSDSRFATTKQDEKTIDAGQVFIGTDCNNTTSLGKLFVDYSVELTIPSAVTEVIGGGGSQEGLTSVSNSNNGILRTIPSKTGIDQTEPVAKMLRDLVAEGVCNPPSGASPQYTVLKFLKDYQGIFGQNLTSTGGTPFLAGNDLFVMKPTVANAPNIEPDTVNAVLQEKISSVGTTNLQSEIWKIAAQAGDLLKIKNQLPVFSPVVGADMRYDQFFGAANLASLVV